MRRLWRVVTRGMAVLGLFMVSLAPVGGGAPSSQPLVFEANHGQTDPRVKLLSRGRGYTLFLTPDEAVLVLKQGSGIRGLGMVRMKLVGANPQPRISGLDALPGRVHYFRGNDPTKWRTNIPIYARVQYKGIYPGIDLIYHGSPHQLEYDFVVAPGADPKAIRLAFEGADNLELDVQGDLVLPTARGQLRLHKPRIYQELGNFKQEISGGYVLLRPPTPSPHPPTSMVRFHVGAYDPRRPLVIDPILTYSTYLGGTGTDSGTRIAVDAEGRAYVTGVTASFDFPATPGAVQPSKGGDHDVFVTKLDAAGSLPVYSTYLGGLGDEFEGGIAIDGAGNAYVTGTTESGGTFPQVNPLQTCNATLEVFVVKLDASGSALPYSTCVSGGRNERGLGIAVDADGNAYVTGWTNSSGAFSTAPFPTTEGAFQTTYGGGASDAFVVKLDASGSAFLYSTFLGGSGNDEGHAVAVDASGMAYLTGLTTSPDFPTVNPLQGLRGVYDAFVTKLNVSGSSLVYSTYLGGSGDEAGHGIAVDASGNSYVTGRTDSSDFPTKLPFQPTNGGSVDAFVTKLNATGSAFIYSTYLGGSGFENDADFDFLARRVGGIAVDASDNAYVTGSTTSSDFPTANPFQPASGGSYDVFITKLNATGSTLGYSTYLGGSGSDRGHGVALDASGNTYVTGETGSTDFPTTEGAFQTAYGGGFGDAFVAKINADTAPDTVRILEAVFFARVSLLVVSATSTAAPDARLMLTVPGCVTEAPMRLIGARYLFVSRACTGLDGQVVTVTSDRGGSARGVLR